MTSAQKILWQHISECPQYINQLAHWFQKEWGHYDHEWTVESLREELKAKIDRNTLPLTMVASFDGELVGTYSLDLEDLVIRPQISPWLASVFVNPKYRHQGIGTLLIKTALQRAQRLGIHTIYLFTSHQTGPE